MICVAKLAKTYFGRIIIITWERQIVNPVEVWKVYPHNDKYEVSNVGRVRRARDLMGGHKRGGLLGLRRVSGEYIQTCLYKDKKRNFIRIHKLVLETFVSDRPRGMECHHKDGVKSNNKLSNLEWITHSENCLLRNIRGEKHGRAKLTEDNIFEIEKLRQSGWEKREIAKKFKVTRQNISRIINGETWKHLKVGI